MTVVPSSPSSTGDEQTPGHGTAALRPDDDAGDERRPFRMPSVLQGTTWRFWTFAPVMAVLILAVPLLAWKGFDILRTEETGTRRDPVTDRDEGGYEALVTPTPTALLIDRDQNQALTGVTLLTRPSQSGGGNIVFFPVGTLLDVPLRTPPEASLVDIYAEGGVTALEQRIETLLGAGIGESIEVPPGQWAGLVAPVAPISVQNPSGVDYTNLNGTAFSFPAGPIELTAAQVGPYLQARSDDETDTVRLTRHEAFWQAWMAEVDAAGETAVPGEGNAGIGAFVRGLSGGPRNLMTLPATPVAVPGFPLTSSDIFRPITLEIVAMVPDLIPFPVGVGRLRTRLVMGVEGQSDLLPDVARTLVQVGGEISVIANDDEFDEEETVIYYFRENQREKAQRLLDALGTGTLVRDTGLNDTADVVVVLGQDYVDAVSGGGATPSTTGLPGATVPGSVPTGGVPGGGIPGGIAPGTPGGETTG